MSIVIITISGDVKTAFARELHAAARGGVDLVIVQKQRKHSLFRRILKLYYAVPLRDLPKEAWYGILLRLNNRVRKALGYFRAVSVTGEAKLNAPRTIEVDSVNSDEVHKILKSLSPDLLVVWGSTILSPRIVHSAKRAVNLHLGYCPYYRGALANQHAVLRGDIERIGATIHYINGKADAGDILEIMEADISKSPQELLLDLNNRAFEKYIDVACRLAAGEDPPSAKQEHVPGNVLLLREWSPSLRYSLGRRILDWERQASISASWPAAAILEAKPR